MPSPALLLGPMHGLRLVRGSRLVPRRALGLGPAMRRVPGREPPLLLLLLGLVMGLRLVQGLQHRAPVRVLGPVPPQ